MAFNNSMYARIGGPRPYTNPQDVSPQWNGNVQRQGVSPQWNGALTNQRQRDPMALRQGSTLGDMSRGGFGLKDASAPDPGLPQTPSGGSSGYAPTWQEMAQLNDSYGKGGQGWMDPRLQSVLQKFGGDETALNKAINQYSYNPNSFAGYADANKGFGMGYGGSWSDLQNAGGTPTAGGNSGGGGGNLGIPGGSPGPTNIGGGNDTGTRPPPSIPGGSPGPATSLPPYTFGSNDGYQFGQQQNYFDPGYAFRLNEGSNALQNSAAARGGLLSGATLKGISNYAQNAASGEFNNAYNRFAGDRSFNYGVDSADRQFDYNAAQDDRNFGYNAQRDDRNFNQQSLRDLMGYGMQGTGGQADTARLLATLLGQNALSMGQTQGAGTMGGSNAISGAISQILQQLLSQSAMNRYSPTGP